MIYVTQALPVNEPGQVQLTREQVFAGLTLKANDALPFVPAMTRCEVINRISDTVFDREVEFRGQSFTERITLWSPNRVIFTRIAGAVLGTIANEIEGDGETLQLRFSYGLIVQGLEPGSQEESDYAAGMKGDYLKAVGATINAMRQLAEQEKSGAVAASV
jgi:hypothetical protein